MRRSARYRWYVTGMLWLVCLLNYADRQAIFSVFPVLRAQFQLTDIQLGYLGSSFMWVYALCGPLAGLVGDRFRRKTVILGGLVFWSLITIATALAANYSQLLLFRGLEGLGEAFYFPASMAMLSAYHGPRTRSRAMAWHQSGVYAGTILGGAMAGWMAEHHGWRSGFYVFGSAGVLLGVALLWLLDEPARREDALPEHSAFNLREAAGAIFSSQMAVVLMVVFIGANFVAVIFLTWLPSYLNRAYHMTLAMAGLNATVYLQVASVVGVITGGVAADRLTRKRSGGRAIIQAIGLLAGAPFLLLCGVAPRVGVFVGAMTGFGFCKGLYDANIWAALHDAVPAPRRAAAVGVMNSLGWLGGGAAPVIVAVAAGRFGMSACLGATSMIYAVLGLILGLAALRVRGDGARSEPTTAGNP